MNRPKTAKEKVEHLITLPTNFRARLKTRASGEFAGHPSCRLRAVTWTTPNSHTCRWAVNNIFACVPPIQVDMVEDMHFLIVDGCKCSALWFGFLFNGQHVWFSSQAFGCVFCSHLFLVGLTGTQGASFYFDKPCPCLFAPSFLQAFRGRGNQTRCPCRDKVTILVLSCLIPRLRVHCHGSLASQRSLHRLQALLMRAMQDARFLFACLANIHASTYGLAGFWRRHTWLLWG